MDREHMIIELIDREGYKGNGYEGVQQVMRYAHMTDFELTREWLKRVIVTRRLGAKVIACNCFRLILAGEWLTQA